MGVTVTRCDPDGELRASDVCRQEQPCCCKHSWGHAEAASSTALLRIWQQQCSGMCISACAPDLLPAAVHHPVVAVKGQAVAQQVEQAGLGRELLRPPPAGRQVTWLARCVHVCAPTETAATPVSAPCTFAAAAVGHAHQPPSASIGPAHACAHLNLTRRGPPHWHATPFTSSHRWISRHARSFTAEGGQVRGWERWEAGRRPCCCCRRCPSSLPAAILNGQLHLTAATPT